MINATTDIQSFVVSKNAKTGISINVSECVPTPWCRAHCYGKRRSASPEGAGANNGPITWEAAQAAYRRNTAIIKAAADSGDLQELALLITVEIDRAKFKFGPGLQLRGNGLGDLFPELCWLYAIIADFGYKMFLFSRRADMIDLLTKACSNLGTPRSHWPYVIGSVDPSTPKEDVLALIEATANHNGKAALAIAAEDKPEDLAAIDLLLADPSIYGAVKVTFGYHTNHKLTGLAGTCLAKWECPATAGQDIVCTECKQCYGGQTI